MTDLILASSSPRRRELLCLLGIPFRVAPLTEEEGPLAPHVPLGEAVEGVALAKARLASGQVPHGLVLAADTVVVVDGEVLGKPKDAANAGRMLGLLSGKTHEVFTGVALVERTSGREGRVLVDHARTEVAFRNLDDREIAAYVATGEPLDKAGAYGIQGRGSVLVSGVRGCFFNVVGLPVSLVYEMLRRLGIEPW
jgi:septum formation protein